MSIDIIIKAIRKSAFYIHPEQDSIVYVDTDMDRLKRNLQEALKQVKNNELLGDVSKWISFEDNKKLFEKEARKNCRVLFDDGTECNYNDNHPLAILTHFKLSVG